MGLFGPRLNAFESALVEHNAQILAKTLGSSLAEARLQCRQLMTMVIEQSKAQGTYDLPNNLGDLILGRTSTRNPALRKYVEWLQARLPMKREEGVRDEDIRWWWNIHDVERRFLLAQDDVAHLALLRSLLKRGHDNDQAAVMVRGTYPIYGDLDDLALGPGDDRPLPFELKDRINAYMVARAAADPDGYKRDMDASSSFNAIIRRDIRSGKI